MNLEKGQQLKCEWSEGLYIVSDFDKNLVCLRNQKGYISIQKRAVIDKSFTLVYNADGTRASYCDNCEALKDQFNQLLAYRTMEVIAIEAAAVTMNKLIDGQVCRERIEAVIKNTIETNTAAMMAEGVE